MYEIPTKVNIGGTEYQIRNNGDYRMVLDCFGALQDASLNSNERLFCSLIIFYEDINSIADELAALFKSIADTILSKYQDGGSMKHLKTVLESEKLVNTYKPLRDNEVVIMTLHKAKGLEFDIVYHLNMNEFEIPSKKYENWKIMPRMPIWP